MSAQERRAARYSRRCYWRRAARRDRIALAVGLLTLTLLVILGVWA